MLLDNWLAFTAAPTDRGGPSGTPTIVRALIRPRYRYGPPARLDVVLASTPSAGEGTAVATLTITGEWSVAPNATWLVATTAKPVATGRATSIGHYAMNGAATPRTRAAYDVAAYDPTADDEALLLAAAELLADLEVAR
jgi:hypothetical protein